ncbi:MAG: septal ring lytic transglycosylase RlpA family protein [Deltaproteobacteria bacterium]|nr:septal ring lytic transglycosylase RlpA family protein [Deltaproteobacteria bacterium]
MDFPIRRLRAPLYALLVLLLAGCGGYTTKVIESPETRELAGWQRPYEVNGQRYNPLRGHKGFQQRGIASWYGKKFHGRKTSNGETYDMYGLSAAHKTLPMGVFVKVTHLGNGRHINVRINDRGPFIAGRIIDLSYGAARQLGIVESGTAQVNIQALGYQQNDHGKLTYRAPSNYDSGSFAVQIGAYSTAENAYALAARMRVRYGKAVVTKAMINGRQFYRVRVGNYQSLERAENAVDGFISGGFSGSFVVAFD